MPLTDAARNYRTANRLLLAVVAFCLVAPFALIPVNSLFPRALTTCLSLRLFHRACPMCGLTRGMHALMTGHLGEAVRFNILTVPLFLFLIAELGFRTYASVATVSEGRRDRFLRTDLRVHRWLGFAYVGYAIGFLIAGAR